MSKKLALQLIERLVQKGERSSAEIVCYDYNISFSEIEKIEDKIKEQVK